MYRHARNLEFEEAARIRDEIERLRSSRSGSLAAEPGEAKPARVERRRLPLSHTPRGSCIVRGPESGA